MNLIDEAVRDAEAYFAHQRKWAFWFGCPNVGDSIARAKRVEKDPPKREFKVKTYLRGDT